MFWRRRQPQPQPQPQTQLEPQVKPSPVQLLSSLIWQMHRQVHLVCHASWATRTAIALGVFLLAVATPAAAAAATPADATAAASMRIQTLQVNCTRDLLDMQLTLNRAFRGLLYAKDFPLECWSRGQDAKCIALRLPTSGCGVRAEPLPDGGMEYTVRIMLQTEQKLRQSTDILRIVRCQLPAKAMGMPLPLHGRDRNARMRALAIAASAAAAQTHLMDTPRVRIWLELGGANGSGSVELGMATTLTVRAIVPGTIGVRVVDCAALDGLGESTQQLLDARGCPIDEQVMPALQTRWNPVEEGWSKQHEEDLVEFMFVATFAAFKFPDRERLHVSCGVQLCKGKCPNLNCRLTEQQLQLNGDQHLAHIEVFNSLAVTAPQIEVDRLRYDRRYNMSVEDYVPHGRPLVGEGTLCLSISKLAISFCILGSIFLVAVIVAIFSLIRTRQRQHGRGSALGLGLSGAGTATGSTSNNSSSRLHRAEICTTMFSSSSESAKSGPRFGGKFLMPLPYYPTTLPYGRVY